MLLQNQKGFCALCFEPLTLEKVNVDHIIPKSLGGTNTLDNLQAVHRKCNWWKGNIENAITYCWRCRQALGPSASKARRHYNKHLLRDWKRKHGRKAPPQELLI